MLHNRQGMLFPKGSGWNGELVSPHERANHEFWEEYTDALLFVRLLWGISSDALP
ncbi:MAG: hypothetical protein IJP61_03925 [Treponema sp.]|nr:hypothetical protein [Treponema sp.]